MPTTRVGEVTITRVVEIPRSYNPTPSMLPDSSADAIARHHGWLKPDFWDDTTGDMGSRIQSYVVKTPTHTVVIDTGVGNNKERHEVPGWNRRQGTYLDDLRAAGVTPEQVDYVLSTHLHVDHVGWNTRLVNGEWVPTFPRAKYVMVGSEWEYWGHEQKEGRDDSRCLTDSVVPIVESGQAVLVDETYAVDEHLQFEPSHGHTPGHSCVRLTTKAGEAVFSGDLMHRVVQVAEPQWSSKFCSDPKHAARTRQAFVERMADSGVLVCAAHFPRPGFIVKKDGGFRLAPAPEA
jgi:glyoxylase-like metal-dependent hydrolase (beta-lactamase superfamily II)